MEQIVVNNVNFSYANAKEQTLKDLSLTINKGDFACILGESGCGKSTLLRLLAGLQFPDGGEILVGGKQVTRPGLDRGVVFQDYSLYPWMTTGKNILITMKQRYPKKKKAELKEEILYYLNQVGLESSVYDKYPFELSGGMRQRCAICRAFALNTSILLMDEPFGALDAVTRYRLQDMVLELCTKEKEDPKTVVFITHDVEEAMYLANKIFVLGMKPSKVIYSYEFQNKQICLGERAELFDQPEYVNLRKSLMNILNHDIERKAKENEKESLISIAGV